MLHALPHALNPSPNRLQQAVRTLDHSCWAPRNVAAFQSSPSLVPFGTAESRRNEERRKAERLLTRVQWKADLLMVSYSRVRDEAERAARHDALQPWRSNVGLHAFDSQQRPDSSGGIWSRNAEAMFKLDFFEFYTLLERLITLCLSAVGCNVSAKGPDYRQASARPGLSAVDTAIHRYHANVLAALDVESCPLHSALGSSEVRMQLGLAKEFRNRWKDADDPKREGVRKLAVPLDLDLQHLLETILRGLELALTIVKRVDDEAAEGHGGAVQGSSATYEMDVEMVDAPFETVEDAMEWEYG